MKALIVDDSRVMRNIVKRIVAAEGFEVAEAADGREALDYLAAQEEASLPDVALIDWNMPVMNGLELVSEIRSTDALRRMTLMMVTTEGEQAQIVRALAAGAHEYLIKPFTPDALVSKLHLLGLVTAAGGAM